MSARYTLIVGTKNWSSWSLRPYLALRATGAAFEEIVVQLRRSESTRTEILKYTPSGRVPGLRIEENGKSFTVFDSLAICETLAERHPEAKLWPHDPGARAEARSISAVMHSSFPELRAALSMDFVRRLPAPPLSDDVKEQIAEITGYWEDARQRFGKGGDFLFGRFSIADCMYAPVVSRFRSYGIALSPALASYSDHVLALAAMRDWWSAAQVEVDQGLA
jgi:glutathione S-transferase